MINDVYNFLRKDIQEKISKKILYGKDCDQLSIQIFRETRRQLSNSTIKRFFGVIKSRFNPSKYTLDTFAVFLGFNDWTDYLNCFDELQFSAGESNTWYNLKSRINILTENSLISLKLKTGYDFEKLIFRKFTKNKFNDFVESGKTATIIAAPDGYGKSTMLIQLIEKYFLDDNAKYKNDIVALIDGGIFFNLYSKNTGIELLNQLLEFRISTSLGTYFRNNPEKRKGRIWIIIDNVDEVFFDKEKYHQLAENLVRIIMANDNGWYKMILTCRPENLDVFTYLTNKNPILNLCWDKVNFSAHDTVKATNVPLFQKNEIETLLRKLKFKHDCTYLNSYHKNLIDVIRNPYLLSLFVEEFKQNEKFSEIVLLNRYIRRRLYSLPYKEEKLFIIDRFIELCHRGKESASVRKDLLLSKSNHLAAYRQLISFGIIYEYILPDEMVRKNTYVKFNSNIIFEFVLFEKWRINKQLNAGLFFKIRDYYQNNVHLQCNLLRLFVRFLFHENRFDVIRKIHSEFDIKARRISNYSELPPCLISVSSAIKDEIRINSRLKKNLVPWLVKSKIGDMLYTELV